ncbi:MAG: hypothetical protein R2880_10740 [Deinococcales bacterium]
MSTYIARSAVPDANYFRVQVNYSFSLTQPSDLYITFYEGPDDLSYQDFVVLDVQGNELLNYCLGCGSPGLQHFDTAGNYRIKVGGTDRTTGRYSFGVYSVNRQSFNLTIDQVV